MLHSPTWFVVVLAVAILGAVAWWPRGRRGRMRLLTRTSRRVGLPPTTDAADLIVRSRRRSLRWSTAGAAAGAAVAAATSGAPLVDGPAPVAFSGLALGATCGWLLAALVAAQRALRPDERRVARVRRTALDDYVPMPERWTARVAGLLCAGLGALAVGVGMPTVATAAGLGVATLVLLEVGGGQVAAAPQPASDPDVLAWQDALRSLDLREAAWAPVVIAFFGVAGAWSAIAGAVAPLASIGLGAAVILYWAQLAVGVLWRRHLDRHYLRRLWPERAARLDAAERGVAPGLVEGTR